jgi:hypothetical protein
VSDRRVELERLLNAEPQRGRADVRVDPDVELEQAIGQPLDDMIRAQPADEGERCDKCRAAAVWLILDKTLCDAHAVKYAKRLDRKTPTMTIPKGRHK